MVRLNFFLHFPHDFFNLFIDRLSTSGRKKSQCL